MDLFVAVIHFCLVGFVLFLAFVKRLFQFSLDDNTHAAAHFWGGRAQMPASGAPA